MTKMTKLFGKFLDKKNILTEKNQMLPFLSDWRGNYTGETMCVLLPETTKQVSKIMKIASEEMIPIVPQGGNTGLVGGGIPDKSGNSVILSLSKMNKIRSFSINNKSMIVEAGCILQNIHDYAEKNKLYFPLNLAAKGSCNIGGNLATNAGGVNVLKYGNVRDLCLGLEIVLMSGETLNLLSPLRKDNTGYDLKNLFVGSEGTLGIITAASLKLFPFPNAIGTAIAGIQSISDGVELLSLLQSKFSGQIEAFEIMPSNLLKIILKHFPNYLPPIAPLPEYIILMEISNPDKEYGIANDKGEIPIISQLEQFLEETFEKKLISDATIATNETKRRAFWELRENASEAIKNEAPFEVSKISEIKDNHQKKALLNFDISVTCDNLQNFYNDASKAVIKIHPSARICAFGHLGDGNFHFNIIDKQDGDYLWNKNKRLIENEIYNVLFKYNGSISAEHGIGQLKSNLLKKTKDKVALELMRDIKKLFDPKNLLNPGKIL